MPRATTIDDGFGTSYIAQLSDLAGNSAIAALADLARASGRLGIDTEFMGEGRYRTLLCLVQVAAIDRKSVV